MYVIHGGREESWTPVHLIYVKKSTCLSVFSISATYGDEDFRLLGDTSRDYSLPIDIIAHLHTEDCFCYADILLDSVTSVYQYNLRGSDYKDLRLLRDTLLQHHRGTRKHCWRYTRLQPRDQKYCLLRLVFNRFLRRPSINLHMHRGIRIQCRILSSP